MTVQTRYHNQGGQIAFERYQDVEPDLEHVKALRQIGADTTGMGDKHAANFPNSIIEIYCNRNKITFAEWMQNPEHLKNMLRDPDLAGFRIWQGAV